MILPIRTRIAVASTLATMVLLVGAGLIFVTTLRSGLENSLDNSLRSSAGEMITKIGANVEAHSTAGDRIELADSTYGQVLNTDGSVLQSTVDSAGQPLVSRDKLRSAAVAGQFFDVSLSQSPTVKHTQELRVLAMPSGRSHTVVAVGLSRDIVNEAVERAGKQLLVVGALVLVMAAIGSWWLARSALKPVDRMRAQAAELEARDAGGGLTVPISRDEIGRLGTTLNALLGRLHSALERERAFVADAGHELRTPLTVLRGELELARRPGRTRAELVETVEVASEETERLIRLAEDLLVLARDEIGSDLRWTEFDVTALLNQACGLVESIAASRSIQLTVRPGELVLVQGDPARLRQALDNVLSNALRYAPDNSSIVLTASNLNGLSRIEITDEGPGFSAALLPSAFERFRRDDEARTRGSADELSHAGTGLGLAIVRKIVRSHGGDATASNRTDRSGARIVLAWPDALVAATGKPR
jgi:signal transduction histidine kinase